MRYLLLVLFVASCSGLKKQSTKPAYTELHRPQIHFSPREKWMNDPNGMIFFHNQYHLFYQYYPDSTVWGPMHWGHATSTDLVHWQHQPIALYPDSLGYIFSGSAVVDSNNTSGFGKDGKIPLVAIFTHHNPKGEKNGSINYQNQSIAYSDDEGNTWTKYVNNPVIKNPGMRDFRDPKVSWYDAQKKWIMTLATKDRVTFYSSKDLKTWARESDFGATVGAHGGVWECPDLFTLDYDGMKIWILMVSINPGGPNGGSATQYFTGEFDGKNFIPYQTDTRWIDYGPDDYAGVTWSNTGNRKIFIGWMSNWQYAMLVPTEKWRSAMTLPRNISLQKSGNKYLLTSKPVNELTAISEQPITLTDVEAGSYDVSAKTGELAGPAMLKINTEKIETFSITFSNSKNEKIIVGYDKATNNFFIDRTQSGNVSFEKGFAGKHIAPRLSDNAKMEFTLIVDNASLELFADDGLSVMTEIFFPTEPLTDIRIQSPDNFKIKTLEYSKLKGIWR